MKRFALAQARISLAEERLQTIRERLRSAREIPAPGEEPAVPSSPESPQNPQDEAALIAAILTITQTEPNSGDDLAGEPGEAVRQAEQAHGEVKQVILNGAPGKAENALFQARLAEIEGVTNTEADTSAAQDTSATDTTARLPVIRERCSQESR